MNVPHFLRVILGISHIETVRVTLQYSRAELGLLGREGGDLIMKAEHAKGGRIWLSILYSRRSQGARRQERKWDLHGSYFKLSAHGPQTVVRVAVFVTELRASPGSSLGMNVAGTFLSVNREI